MHKNCKTPQLSDAELIHYLVKRNADNDAADLPSAMAVVSVRNRGPPPVSPKPVPPNTKAASANSKKAGVKASTKSCVQSSVLTSDPKKSKRKHHEVITVSDEVISPSHYKEIKHIVDAPKLNVVSDDDYQRRRMKELTERENNVYLREKKERLPVFIH